MSAALAMVDGRAATKDIVESVLDIHADAFHDRDRAHSTLESALARWARVSP